MFNENSRTAPVCATRSARRHVLSSPLSGVSHLRVYRSSTIHTYIQRVVEIRSQSTTKVCPLLCGISQDSLTRARNTCASQLRFAPLLAFLPSRFYARFRPIREHSLLSKSIVHSYVRLYNVKYNSI